MCDCGKPVMYKQAYVAWMGISERRMTVYPAGEFHLFAFPLQVDQFQRIDGVFRRGLMLSMLLQNLDSG